jgi:hypothetical protein
VGIIEAPVARPSVTALKENEESSACRREVCGRFKGDPARPDIRRPNRGPLYPEPEIGTTAGHLRSSSVMASRLQIDQASVTDNDVARQVEFAGEIDGDEYDFAVKYAVLKELSGDEPEEDALELFERFSDEILDVCAELAMKLTGSNVVIVDENDLE